MKRKRRRDPLIGICDDLWKQLIILIANNRCERCYSPKTLQAHHIYSRTYWTIRYDLKNGVCLCRKCHIYWAHKNAVEFAFWIKDIRDLEYLELRKDAIAKIDMKLNELYLRKKIKELKASHLKEND